MERELESKVFMLENYIDKFNMDEEIKKYIKNLKIKYTNATITKEFYKGENILVRATEVYNKLNVKKNEKNKEIDDWYIRQRKER